MVLKSFKDSKSKKNYNIAICLPFMIIQLVSHLKGIKKKDMNKEKCFMISRIK